MGFFRGNDATTAGEGGLPGEDAALFGIVVANDRKLHLAGGFGTAETLAQVLDLAGSGALLILKQNLDLTAARALRIVPQDGVIRPEPPDPLRRADRSEKPALLFTADHRIRGVVDLDVEHFELLDLQRGRRAGAGTEEEQWNEEIPVAHTRDSSSAEGEVQARKPGIAKTGGITNESRTGDGTRRGDIRSPCP